MSFPMNLDQKRVMKDNYMFIGSPVEITETHKVYGTDIEIAEGTHGHIYTGGIPHSSAGSNDIPVVLEGSNGFIPVDKRYIKEL